MQWYTGDWLKDPNLGQCSPATRGIWTDMLSLMHENDQSGELVGTAESLARICRCSPTELRTAVTELSVTRTANVTECREIITVVNRRMHRENKERINNRLRQREFRDKEAGNKKVTTHSSSSSSTSVNNSPNGELSGKPDAPPKLNGHGGRDIARRVLDFLNEKTGREYRPTDVNLNFILARLKEGYDETACRQVIVRKCRQWKADDKMAEYLRPSTLFNREKFSQYAGELVEVGGS